MTENTQESLLKAYKGTPSIIIVIMIMIIIIVWWLQQFGGNTQWSLHKILFSSLPSNRADFLLMFNRWIVFKLLIKSFPASSFGSPKASLVITQGCLLQSQ